MPLFSYTRCFMRVLLRHRLISLLLSCTLTGFTFADEKANTDELKLDIFRYALVSSCMRDASGLASLGKNLAQFDLTLDQKSLCNCVGGNLIRDPQLKAVLLSADANTQLSAETSKKQIGGKTMQLAFACASAILKEQLQSGEKKTTTQ